MVESQTIGRAVTSTEEPVFTLRASDPLAPFLVSIWASLRYFDPQSAHVKYDKLLERSEQPDVFDTTSARKALDLSVAMFRWRMDKELDPK